MSLEMLMNAFSQQGEGVPSDRLYGTDPLPPLQWITDGARSDPFQSLSTMTEGATADTLPDIGQLSRDGLPEQESEMDGLMQLLMQLFMGQ
jgi:hypothetical protein